MEDVEDSPPIPLCTEDNKRYVCLRCTEDNKRYNEGLGLHVVAGSMIWSVNRMLSGGRSVEPKY